MATATKKHALEQQYATQLEQLQSQLQAFLAAESNVTTTTTANNETLHSFLQRTEMDDALVKYVLLYEATPQGLAEFASQGPSQEQWIEQLLLNNDSTQLLKELLLADGAKVCHNNNNNKKKHPWLPAQYGAALNIYHTILAQSEHARDTSSVCHRLALAVALEHSVPLPQRNAEQSPGGNAFVDPIQRYWSYKGAYLQGELDPMFDRLSVWELRFVVDGEEPDEISEWGRRMLQNYRPDHILCENNYHWKYVEMVRSNIRYGSQNVKNDRPDLQFFQNILMNGGVCGRRAFFGRFLLRAFGIPTTARPSPGHGALIHWTPNQYWVPCLGGGFGCGTTKTRYKKDTDFLASAKARTNRDAYWKVKRAQWYGDVCGETRIFGEHELNAKQPVSFWYGVSLKIQEDILKDLEANPSAPPFPVNKDRRLVTLTEKVSAAPPPPDAKKIQYGQNGMIVIPAAAYSKPRQTKDVKVMKSFSGGLQIYLPPFQPQGLTIMRGGTFKSDSNGCSSGRRLKSGGYGKYHDWGFRVAISGGEGGVVGSCPKNHVTIDIRSANNKKVPMEFVYIEPGTFIMGGEGNKDGRFECVEVPKHQVTLTKGFYLGKYPVTQLQYQAVMGSNPSKSTKSPDCPVDNIGETEATSFCDKLVETIGKDFRLPTEAEWEYACRAGQGDHKWFFGDDPSQLGEYAWFKDNSDGKSHPVGQLKPNHFGLYDIYGNVYERMSDKYDKNYYAKSPSMDPTGPSQGTKSVFEYDIKLPQAGQYSLCADVVTANDKQRLNVTVNGDSASTTVLEFPFTNGIWQKSASLTVALKQGENTLRFWRDCPPQFGVAIKSFTLTPIREQG